MPGWREGPVGEMGSTGRVGVRIYRAAGPGGQRWDRHLLDDGGMACEDLTAADLNGDRRPDLIASGRATHNLRVYWNGG